MPTDIIASIGPASCSVEAFVELILAGATVFRFNYSHQPHEVQKEWIKNLRLAEKKTRKVVKTMQDVQGFKIRLGNLNRFKLEVGERVILDSSVPYEIPEVLEEEALVDYNGMPIPVANPIITKNAVIGSILYVGDGNIGFRVIEKPASERLICETIGEGELGIHKAITLHGEIIEENALTLKDYEDIKQGTSLKYDYLAISFTQTAKDIQDCQDFLKSECDKWRPKIIAKIESKLGMQNIEKIVDVADGVMVARGDLALHTDFKKLYLYEKRIIELCKEQKKYSVVATQMLKSLESGGLVPSRAEIIDIGNAVYLGANATMLSGETTVGTQPAYAVSVMRGIINETEKGLIAA